MEASFYPAVPSQSFLVPNFDEMMKLEKEYTDFYDKYQRVVLISFGTMFMPPIEEMDLIIDAIKLSDPKVLGFIISMKDYAPSYEGIKALNWPNIMLKTHVPQKQILNHEKTLLFLTHCGANGVVEALYYGKPMIGFPKMSEQKSVSLKLKLLDAAWIKDETTTPEILAQKIEEISAPESP